jgi:hypothetical protein
MDKLRSYILMLLAFFLTNCATVQNILQDKPKYINEHIRVDKLERDTIEIIAKQPKLEQSFKKIVATYNVTTKDLDGKEDTSRKRIYTIENIGDGYNRFDIEDFSNDVKFHEKFQLTYGGIILPLITHGFYMNNSSVSGINPIIVTKLDYQFAGVTENKEYTIEYFGEVIGKYKLDCKSNKFYPASNINNSIPGLAIDVTCNTFINNIKRNTETYTFLKEFNLTLFTSNRSKDGEFSVKMTSFTNE